MLLGFGKDRSMKTVEHEFSSNRLSSSSSGDRPIAKHGIGYGPRGRITALEPMLRRVMANSIRRRSTFLSAVRQYCIRWTVVVTLNERRASRLLCEFARGTREVTSTNAMHAIIDVCPEPCQAGRAVWSGKE